MADRPSFPVPAFPEWAVDLADRIRRLGEMTGDSREQDDEDRYDGPLFCGMVLRPSVHVGGRAVGWRLSTVAEARAWRDEYPDWYDLPCVCGHTRRQHSTIWGADDKPIGEHCDECDCTDPGARPMTAPTVADAAARAVVVLPDGRTARLLSIPAPSARRSTGNRASVLLPSGAVLSVDAAVLEIGAPT